MDTAATAGDRKSGGFLTRTLEARSHRRSTTRPKVALSRSEFFAEGTRVLGAAATDCQSTILTINIDAFRDVNHHLGFTNGDVILDYVATTLIEIVGPYSEAVVGRMGGDEFAVLLPHSSNDDTMALSTQIINRLRKPMDVADVKISLDTSIGVSYTPVHGVVLADLLVVSERAMLRAKTLQTGVAWGGSDVATDTPQSQLVRMGDLARAIAEDELRVHFQPKISLSNRSLQGVEALVRWPHPTYGFISPAEFVVAAEQTGLIQELTRFVLNASLKQCRDWFDHGLQVRVAVNVSTRSLLDPRFVANVARLLEMHRISGEFLVLEITEGSLMQDPVKVSAAIERIRSLGVEIALDDFGTGSSSLAYLAGLTFDEIKIDRSFLNGITTGSPNIAIIRAAVTMGKELGLRVVVEGIETEEQATIVASLGAEIGQGFLFARPMPGPEIIGLVVPKMHFAKPIMFR
jgi:diguanylate cyclase (GGDEF)-like protein